MKIDRLIGILSILLQQEKVTAPYLAERFEVSRRTINRDIEDICKAGIPLVTSQGRNGGISIMAGYRIDHTLLTSADMKAILAGLKSLDSVSETKQYERLMEKISGGNQEVICAENHIRIDLSSWYRSSLAPKIRMIQAAIERNEKLVFDYCAPGGDSRRIIEPYFLVFQWASWYVWGYCESRGDYRMFKLNRILDIRPAGEFFTPRNAPEPDFDSNRIFPSEIEAEIIIEPDLRWRLIEEYGRDSFEEMDDGRLFVRSGFTDRETLFGWVLSFQGGAELIKPEELRKSFLQMVKKIGEKYE